MDPLLLLACLAMAILGQGVQIFGFKIPSGKKRAKAAGAEYSVKDFFKEDWTTMVLTLIVVCMVMIGIGELAAWKPIIMNFIRWFFGLLGFCGSSIALSVGSKYEGMLLNMMGKKAGIADTTQPDAVSNVIKENKAP